MLAWKIPFLFKANNVFWHCAPAGCWRLYFQHPSPYSFYEPLSDWNVQIPGDGNPGPWFLVWQSWIRALSIEALCPDPDSVDNGAVWSHHSPIKMNNRTIQQNLSKRNVLSFLQQAPPSSTADREDSFRPGSLFRQLADQDEDTSTPSLFKLSWLSGMAK